MRLFFVICFLFILKPSPALAYGVEKIYICNTCPYNVNSIALQAALGSGNSAAVLHVINNKQRRLDSYQVEYFPETRYFHVEKTVNLDGKLANEVNAYFNALTAIQAAKVDFSTLPFKSAWDLAGSEGNQQQLAENFINSRNTLENLSIVNQFFHRKVASIMIDPSDILIQRWVYFNDGSRALIDINALGVAGERKVKVVALRTDDGKVIPLTKNDLYTLKRVIFEFRERRVLQGFVEAMQSLGVSVIGVGALYDYLDSRKGTVTVTNCDTGTCNTKEKPATQPN
ncbi:hypothetical protein [Rheinheimera sp.]|uniref:hypothetical protein n=1 Tax=Rheinheimera sp. TaxID=1869214 RepID=UPI004048AD82